MGAADLEIEDMSEKTFSQHKGSVFCVAVSKSEEYVLTGGEDDLAYLWKITGRFYNSMAKIVVLFTIYYFGTNVKVATRKKSE